MATTNTSIHRATIALGIPKTVPALDPLRDQRRAEDDLQQPHFPSPIPALAVLMAVDRGPPHHRDAAALSRAKGTATVRNGKRLLVVSQLQQLRGYVQAVADATPEDGAAIIQSAGMPVRKLPVRTARTFAAKQGALSGTAKITAASAGPRSAYDWQSSTDGGKTWINAPSTIQAKTTITGLPVGSPVQFRYRPVTRTGEGDWSQVVVLLVK